MSMAVRETPVSQTGLYETKFGMYLKTNYIMKLKNVYSLHPHGWGGHPLGGMH